jgi:hypothetical protein
MEQWSREGRRRETHRNREEKHIGIEKRSEVEQSRMSDE